MPEHRISVHPSRPLQVINSDLIVEVHADEVKLGELRLSRGSVDWVPGGHRTPITLTWEQFDRLMRDQT